MGLEVEELLLACEEEFGVYLDSQTVARLSTVAGLYHAITRELDAHRRSRCPRVRVFFSLRAALARESGQAPRSIRRATSLAAILPVRGRQRAWAEVQEALTYPIPTLKMALPDGVLAGIAIGVGLPLGLLLGVLAVAVFETSGLWIAGPLVSALFPFAIPALLFVALSHRLRHSLPEQTMGSLIDRVTLENTWGFRSDGTPWDSTSVWLHLRRMISSRFDVEEERIVPETDFFRDLGAG